MDGLRNADRSEVERIFDKEQARLDENNDFAFSVLRANLLTNLAGQLFVRDIEAGHRVRKLNIDDPGTFLRLPFNEAIEHFLARGIISYEEFEKLSNEERARAFAVKDAAMANMIDRVKRDLDRAMKTGDVSLRDFINSYKIEGVAAHYSENLYRTATATSYQAGRLRQMQDPDVIDALPFWEYVTVGDDRVRDFHAALNGKIWQASDPQALEYYPPLGYQCRCSVIAREDDGPGSSVVVPPLNLAADEGFGGDPISRIAAEAA